MRRDFFSDIEGFFNLVFAHFITLLDLKSPETRQQLDALVQTIASSSGSTSIKYRLYALSLQLIMHTGLTATFQRLSNLFNSIPRQSSLRYAVYTTLLEVASANDELHVLGLSKEDVDQWLRDWDISEVQKSEFLKSIADAYAKCEQPYV